MSTSNHASQEHAPGVDASSTPPARSRSTKIAFAALFAVGAVSLLFLVHPWYEAGVGTNDGSMYILSAKALLAGDGYSYLGRPFTVRPPGMSLLIAPLIAWFGLDFYAFNLLVGAFGVASVLFLFALVRPRLGTAVAFCIALLVWFNASFQHMCNQVMSDVPGVAAILGSLLIDRWARRAPSIRRDLVLAASIGLATYLRTITILLLPAILIARWFAERRTGHATRGPSAAWIARRVLPLAVGAVLVALPWALRNAAHPPETPVDQNYIYSYGTGMWHADVGDPASPRLPLSVVLERVPKRALQILSLLGTRMRDSTGKSDELARAEEPAGAVDVSITPARVAGAIIVGLALVTLARHRRASEWMLFLMLGVVAIYFGFQDRLVLPIFVLAIPAALEALVEIAGRRLGAPVCRAGACALVLAFGVHDFAPRAGWTQIEAQHQAYSRFCSEVESQLPSDARLAAPIGWHYSVYLNRPVYSLMFAIRRAGNVGGAESVIDKYGVNTVILAPFTAPERELMKYFQQRYGSVMHTSQGGMIVRVRA
jgi:hypothetical protein